MKKLLAPAALALLCALPALAGGGTPKAAPIPNPAIDPEGYFAMARESAALRATRRVSEADFLRMAAEPGTVVLDARGADKFALLHVKGAVSLPFTDFTAGSLAKVLPSKDTRVLIYCNNNFRDSELAFATKAAPAALNLSTFQSLMTYGYRNVYELGPRVDPKASKLAFEGTTWR